MAAIIEIPASQSGQTLYAVIHDASGQLWNGSAFETFNGSNWSNYVTALTEQTSSGYYKASFPSGVASGKYTIVYYAQQGGSPALGDPTIGSGQIYWNGTIEEQTVGSVVAATAVTLSASQPSLTIGTVTNVTNIGAPGLASIQAQLQALLNATAMPELTTVPSASPTIFQALMLAYMALRNQHIQTTLQEQIYNSAGTVVGTAQTTDDGTQFVKGRFQ